MLFNHSYKNQTFRKINRKLIIAAFINGRSSLQISLLKNGRNQSIYLRSLEINLSWLRHLVHLNWSLYLTKLQKEKEKLSVQNTYEKINQKFQKSIKSINERKMFHWTKSTRQYCHQTRSCWSILRKHTYFSSRLTHYEFGQRTYHKLGKCSFEIDWIEWWKKPSINRHLSWYWIYQTPRTLCWVILWGQKRH